MPRGWRWLGAFVAALLVGSTAVALAAGTTTTVNDPKGDTKGGFEYDLKSIKAQVLKGGKKVRHTVTFHNSNGALGAFIEQQLQYHLVKGQVDCRVQATTASSGEPKVGGRYDGLGGCSSGHKLFHTTTVNSSRSLSFTFSMRRLRRVLGTPGKSFKSYRFWARLVINAQVGIDRAPGRATSTHKLR